MAENHPVVYINTAAALSNLASYANDGAFVSAKGSAAAEGDVYNNTSSAPGFRYFSNSAWHTAISLDQTQTATNKTLTSPIINTGTLNVPTINGLKKAITVPAVSNYNVLTSDVLIAAAAGTTTTVTLPAASGNSGTEYEVLKTDNNFTAISITDGTFTTAIHTQNEAVRVRSNGSTYLIIDRRIPSVWAAVPSAFTGSWVSNTTYTTQYKRIGDSACFEGKIALAGAPTSATLTITLTGLTIDTAKLTVTDNTKVFGIATVWDNSSGSYWQVWPSYNNSTTLVIQRTDDDATGIGYGGVNATNPITFAINDFITYNTGPIPISGWNG